MVITASDSVVVKRINPAVCLTPADILYIQWVRVLGDLWRWCIRCWHDVYLSDEPAAEVFLKLFLILFSSFFQVANFAS